MRTQPRGERIEKSLIGGRLMGGNHASVILAVRRFGRISGNRIGWYKNATVEAAYRTAKKSLEKN